MGQSYHVVGFVEADEKWKRMKKIVEACQSAGVEPPSEVEEYFDGCYENIKLPGLEINLDDIAKDTEVYDGLGGWIVDLEEVKRKNPNIKKIMFQISY